MLSIGTRIGPYEVTGALGAGGMGEVYRAHDERLGRDVALKVLPGAFVSDSARLARFQREAQVLAALKHPNIGSIYGLEESAVVMSGVSQTLQALVLELVEGDTLADRIARGPVAVEEALPIARQIAEALEAAHEQGIVHRDLKPANVKVAPDGLVKVLDFGLAKLNDPNANVPNVPNDPNAPTASPTLSVQATMAGVILGAAAYMSPEQARGRVVDKRADIWAFGCVLYEMLTGKRAFDGDDITDTIVAIVSKDPDWSALPVPTPPAVRSLLRRCLEKDAKRRLRDIGEARLALEDAGRVPPAEIDGVRDGPDVGARKRSPWLRAGGFALALAATAIVAGTAVWFATRPAPPRVSRLVIAPDGDAALRPSTSDRDVAIAPEGTHVVYVGTGSARTSLFVRSLDQLGGAALGSFQFPRQPFFSPDGQWVGFFEQPAILQRVAVTGGPAVTIARAEGAPRGATWGPDDTIILATANLATGLQRVSAAGGDVTVLTKPNRDAGEGDHVWPEWLPGGGAVLFTITPTTGSVDHAQIAVFDVRTGAHKILVRGGSHAKYVRSGHLVYGVSGTLRAVAFDLARLEVIGTSVPVVPRVITTPLGAAGFDLTNDGTLVYVEGDVSAGTAGRQRSLVWVDRQGREEPLKAPLRAYTYPRLSPDGTRVALDIRDQMNDVWVWDLRRDTLTRITFGTGGEQYPLWTPDGRRLLFGSFPPAGRVGVVWQAADGTGTAEPLTDNGEAEIPFAISPDGNRVVVRTRANNSPLALDLTLLLLAPQRRTEMLIQTPHRELNADISPDGRWLAYESDESGRREVYVRPFPDVSGGRWQISTDGGTRPVFARTGREVFYFATTAFADADVTLMSVSFQPGSAWIAGTPSRVFAGRYFYDDAPGGEGDGRTYDVSSDGRRFLMIKEAGSPDQQTASSSVVMVLNWTEELKRIVPRN